MLELTLCNVLFGTLTERTSVLDGHNVVVKVTLRRCLSCHVTVHDREVLLRVEAVPVVGVLVRVLLKVVMLPEVELVHLHVVELLNVVRG